MKLLQSIFLLFVGTGLLSAQVYDDNSRLPQGKSAVIQDVLDNPDIRLFSASASDLFSPCGFAKSNLRQRILEKQQTTANRLNSLPAYRASTEMNSETSILTEVGYLLAMETVFTGMSYLASRRKGIAPTIAGGFDLFMGSAGLVNTSYQNSGVQKAGHFLISAGFFAKAFYNFRLGKNHNKDLRFWTNFVGFNVLVFTGYYLDTLN